MATIKWATAGRAILGWVPDCMLLGGASLMCYGLWLISPPLAYIAGGVVLGVLGALLARG